MTDRRRAPRVRFENDELQVDLRVEGKPGLAIGRLVDASDLGFFVDLDRPVDVQSGDQVVIKIRPGHQADELGVVGVTSPCVVRRAVSPTRLGLEAPSLTSRVRQDLADLVWERSVRRSGRPAA